MKNKIKLIVVFTLLFGIIPVLDSFNISKSFAQEDTSTGWIPDYAISEIEKAKDAISPEEWEKIESLIKERNYYALKHILITISAANGGWVSILFSNIIGAFFNR